MTAVLAPVLGLLSLLAILAGPALAAEADEATQAAIVEKAVTRVIVPAFQRLAETASNTAARLEASCTEPDEEGIEQSQARFRDLVRAWARVDFLRFGPLSDEGRYERFAFWPDPRGVARRQIRQMLTREAPVLLQQGALKSQSAAVQGLPALEILLFESDLPLSDPAAAYRCQLAAAVGKNLASLAAEARDGWLGQNGWSRLMARPGPENPVYRSRAETLTELLKAILTGVEQMADQRIRPALGEDAASARPQLAPYHRSGATAEYLVASALGLQEFVAKSDIMTLLPADKGWIANSVSFEIENLITALRGLSGPAEALFTDPDQRGKARYAQGVLSSLKSLFHDQFSPAVGLSPGFNALDGD